MSKDRQVDEPSLLDGAEINLRLKGDGWVATIRVGDQQRAGHGSTAPIALIDMAMDLRTWIKSRNVLGLPPEGSDHNEVKNDE